MRVAALVLTMIACNDEAAAPDSGDEGTPLPDGPWAAVSITRIDIDEPTIYVSAMSWEYLPGTATTTAEPLNIDTCGPLSTGSTTETFPVADTGEVTVAVDGTPIALQENLGLWSGTLAEWPAGGTLSFAASGGDIPDFDVPDLLTLQDPVEPATTEDEPDGAITVTWAGESAGEMVIGLGTGDTAVFCRTTDDGSFTIPAADVAAAGGGQVLVNRFVWGTSEEPGITVSGFVHYSTYVD